MINLSEYNIPQSRKLVGDETFPVPAGRRVQVRHNNSGEIVNVLDETVPAGKTWSVTVFVTIEETDV